MRRVCYIGSFTGPTDEGMRNVAESMLRAQTQHCEVLGVNPSSILFHSRRLKSFRPNIVHYLSGPTFISMMLLKLARIETSCDCTVMTATHPWLPGMRFFSSMFKPDVLLVQSSRQKKFLEGLSERLVFVPNGVDLIRFEPMEANARRAMRASLGVGESDFMILHVGNLREGRNLDVLARLSQTPGLRVVLASSTTVKRRSERMVTMLRSAGVHIVEGFVERIQDVYGASDCYVFPTLETGRAIEMPLSVLEAMACNVPVVSTPFGGLPDVFVPNKWLRFAMTLEEIERNVHEIRELLEHEENECDTRHQVTPLSWEKIVERINGIYDELTFGDAIEQTGRVPIADGH